MRATMSAALPGEEATRMRIGRAGYGCAPAVHAHVTQASRLSSPGIPMFFMIAGLRPSVSTPCRDLPFQFEVLHHRRQKSPGFATRYGAMIECEREWDDPVHRRGAVHGHHLVANTAGADD